MFRVLAVVWCLMGVALAVPLEGDDTKKETDLVSATSRTLTARSDDGGVFLGIVVITFIVLAIITVVTTLLSDLLLGNITLGLGRPISRGFITRSLSNAMADDESMFSNILNSIDPVDMSFRFMEVENNACRKRTLCQLSATPFIGQLFRYISPNISSLKDYQEAMLAGEALQDCALLFAECPENQYFDKK